MTQFFLTPSKSELRGVAALALVGFAGVFALQLVQSSPDNPGAIAYAPSVALIALEFGFVPGILAGFLGTALYAFGFALESDTPSFAHLVTRLIPFLLIGGLMGWLADRVRAGAAAQLVAEDALAAARLARRQATELNDNVVQGLALAKYALARNDPETAARMIDGTLGQARRMISDLTGSADVEPGQLRRESPVEH